MMPIMSAANQNFRVWTLWEDRAELLVDASGRNAATVIDAVVRRGRISHLGDQPGYLGLVAIPVTPAAAA